MRLSLDTPSDQVILRALREGRLRQAADSLVLIYSGAVYRACRLACVDSELAEELAYETYAALFSDLSALHGAESVKSQLLGAAQERVMAKLLPDLSREPAAAPSLANEGAPAERENLRRALARLSARERAILGVAYGFTAVPFPFAAGSVLEELAAALQRLKAAMAQSEEPSDGALVARLAEVHWRVPERLQRRLEVLCSSLGG